MNGIPNRRRAPSRAFGMRLIATNEKHQAVNLIKNRGGGPIRKIQRSHHSSFETVTFASHPVDGPLLFAASGGIEPRSPGPTGPFSLRTYHEIVYHIKYYVDQL